MKAKIYNKVFFMLFNLFILQRLHAADLASRAGRWQGMVESSKIAQFLICVIQVRWPAFFICRRCKEVEHD